MEKVVYLILGREKDTFKPLYVGECEKTEKNDFFTQNDKFQCWIKTAGAEEFLYLAILPRFESNEADRKRIVNKTISHYKPVCNVNKE